jgi:hypothetical protein
VEEELLERHSGEKVLSVYNKNLSCLSDFDFQHSHKRVFSFHQTPDLISQFQSEAIYRKRSHGFETVQHRASFEAKSRQGHRKG